MLLHLSVEAITVQAIKLKMFTNHRVIRQLHNREYILNQTRFGLRYINGAHTNILSNILIDARTPTKNILMRIY